MKKSSGKQASYGLLVGLLIGMEAMGWARQGYAGGNMPNEEAQRSESGHSVLDALSQPVSIAGSTPDSPPRITLRVYNYAHVDPAMLTRAREVATAIFKESGVETAWIDCPISAAEFEKYPACHRKTEPTHFVLRVMTASMAMKLPTSDHPLGFAHECGDDQPGCVANIFYARVAELARRTRTAPETILGHAMAHEVGHLLLGPNSHSSSGVMCGEWSLDDLRLMSWHYLLFTPGQSGQLRTGLARRTRLELNSDSRASDLPPGQ